MLEKDREVVRKAYGLYKNGTEDLSEALIQGIGKVAFPSGRVQNMSMALNQMVRASNKKTGKYANRFILSDPNKVLDHIKTSSSKSSKTQIKNSRRSQLDDYLSSPSKTGRESNAYVPSGDKYREVIDQFNKMAHIKNELEDKKVAYERNYLTASNNLSYQIKQAYGKGLPMLEIEAALIMSNPNQSHVASGYCKKVASELNEIRSLRVEDKEKFFSINHDAFGREITKMAEDEGVDMEDGILKKAYENLLTSYTSKKTNERNISFVKIALNKTNEAKEAMEKTGFLGGIGKKIKSMSGWDGLGDGTKNIIRGAGIATGVNSAIFGGMHMMDKAVGAGVAKFKQSSGYKAMIEKNPDLKDDEITKEYYSLIADLNPVYASKPLQMGQLIKTLMEQQQIVTPDMAANLAKSAPKVKDQVMFKSPFMGNVTEQGQARTEDLFQDYSKHVRGVEEAERNRNSNTP